MKNIVEYGLNGGVNEVQASYLDEEAADFLEDYDGTGFFFAVHILLGGVMRRQNTLRLADSL